MMRCLLFALVVVLVGCGHRQNDVTMIDPDGQPDGMAKSQLVEFLADPLPGWMAVRINGTVARQRIDDDENIAGWQLFRHHLDALWDQAAPVTNGRQGERAVGVTLAIARTLPWRVAERAMTVLLDGVDLDRGWVPYKAVSRPFYRFHWRCRNASGKVVDLGEDIGGPESDAVLTANIVVVPAGLPSQMQPSDYRAWFAQPQAAGWEVRVAGSTLCIPPAGRRIDEKSKLFWPASVRPVGEVSFRAFSQAPVGVVLAVRAWIGQMPELRGCRRTFPATRQQCSDRTGSDLFYLGNTRPYTYPAPPGASEAR